MSIRTLSASILSCGGFLAACFDPSGLPEVDLDAEGAKAVLRCQDKVKGASRSFVNAKLKELHTCVDKLLAVEVRGDSGLLSENRLERDARRAEADCDHAFERIAKFESTYIDSIVRACEDVEEEILTMSDAGDPLGFRAMAEDIFSISSEDIDIQSVEDYASFLCGLHEFTVFLLLSVEAPRAVGLLNGLDSFEEVGDERCIDVISGVSVPPIT